MNHFFIGPDQVDGNLARITGSDVNHIVNVLRMETGEELEVSGGNRTWLARILSVERELVTVELVRECESTELPCSVTLLQGLPKGDKLENIIQKSVELGVSKVVPVAMKRCVAKLEEPKKQRAKLARWQAVAESAAKQSRRAVVPEVGAVLQWKEALALAGTFDVLLLPYENAKGMEETRRLLSGIKPGCSIGIVIGPEGGFEDAEVEQMREAGAGVISLGRRILRTETAGPAVLAMLGFCLEP